MTKSQLETFSSLAKTLNYAHTAEILYISQPAVTQQIKNLEDEIGVQLFIRNTRKVELTAAGMTFYEDCQNILSRLDSAIVRARLCDQQFHEKLRIGYSGNMALTLLDKILISFRKVMPNVQIHITSNDPIKNIHSFQRDDMDITFGSYEKNTNIVGTSFEPLFQGSFVCVMHESSPLSAKERITIKDFDHQSMIFLSKECCPAEMRRVQEYITENTRGIIPYYSDSAAITVTMILAGIGIAVMPRFACPDREGIVIKPVDNFGSIPYGIYYKKGDHSQKVKLFIQCAKEVYGHYSE